MIPAIPTRYRGYQFRSRLEARWAAMFDRLRWRWQYEPLDLAGWVPDFLLAGPSPPLLVEVKPVVEWPRFGEHYARIAHSGWAGPVLLVGALVPWEMINPSGLATIGQLRQGTAQRWFPAQAAWCRHCDKLAPSTLCPWCGALILGDLLRRAGTSIEEPIYRHPTGDLRSWVAQRWAEAGNDTRWFPR